MQRLCLQQLCTDMLLPSSWLMTQDWCLLAKVWVPGLL